MRHWSWLLAWLPFSPSVEGIYDSCALIIKINELWIIISREPCLHLSQCDKFSNWTCWILPMIIGFHLHVTPYKSIEEFWSQHNTFGLFGRNFNMWWNSFGNKLIPLSLHAWNVMFMSIDEYGSFASQFGKSSFRIGERLKSCRNLGARDGSTLLFDEHFLIKEWVYGYNCHVKSLITWFWCLLPLLQHVWWMCETISTSLSSILWSCICICLWIIHLSLKFRYLKKHKCKLHLMIHTWILWLNALCSFSQT